MKKERTIVEIDNRDDRTTWLHLEDGSYVEVDPIELFINMLENNYPHKDEFVAKLEVDDFIDCYKID